jgi:hypothetical protein
MSAKIGWMEIRGIFKTRRDNMDEIRTMDQAGKAVANREGKYLTFVLAGGSTGSEF